MDWEMWAIWNNERLAREAEEIQDELEERDYYAQFEE